MSNWPRLHGRGVPDPICEALDHLVDQMLVLLEGRPDNGFRGARVEYDENRVEVRWRGETPRDVKDAVGRLTQEGQTVNYLPHGGDGPIWRAGWELSWRFDRAGIAHSSFGPTGEKRTLTFTVLRQDDAQAALASELVHDLEVSRAVKVRLAWRDELPPPSRPASLPFSPTDEESPVQSPD